MSEILLLPGNLCALIVADRFHSLFVCANICTHDVFNQHRLPVVDISSHTIRLVCPTTFLSGVIAKGNIFNCNGMNWTILSNWTSAPTNTPVVVIRHSFARWGLLAFVSSSSVAPTSYPVLMRTPIGQLDKLSQPKFNLTADFYKTTSSSLTDYPIHLAAAYTKDGEADYPSIAAQLTPQRDTAEISHAADVNKFVVTFAGRVKCASTSKIGESSSDGSIAELQNLHDHFAPANQKIVFDPQDYLKFWPIQFDDMKAGLIGGHLGVAHIGGFTALNGSGDGGGFELIAFGPVPPNESGGKPAPTPPTPPPAPSPPPPHDPWQCYHFGADELHTIEQCIASGKSSTDCQKQACSVDPARKWTGGNNKATVGCGTCYCCAPYTPQHLPRLPNINYNPGVFVMLRGVGWDSPRYFYASNTSTFELTHLGDAQFFQRLLAVYRKFTSLLSPAMKVEVPASDRRQIDMANAALLSTMNNFVGNQPNYGNGATYWSYGREDNGTLPLILLSVDEALLNWGVCDLVQNHVDFYFSNYIAPDGKTIYGCCGWPGAPDSLSDYGRLVDLFIRTVKMCDPPTTWTTKQLGPASRIASYMLQLHATAPPPAPPPHPGPPPPCTFGPPQNHSYIANYPSEGPGSAKTLHDAMATCALAKDCGGVTFQHGKYQLRAGHQTIPVPRGTADATSWLVNNTALCRPTDPAMAGLVLGAPEHDWSRTTNRAFYNNNAWLATGMHRFGKFLASRSHLLGGDVPSTLASDLLGNASQLANAVQASLQLVQVRNGSDHLVFVPSYAQVNVTPYTSMHSTREASYSNFRFYSETMMADIIPPEIEANWLDWHNNRGGRVGGANRFEGWLDDMPTAGWGYGALANNATGYFLGLLYGHAATYQSPGTFHSTEQLSFHGGARFRDFLHIHDPAPDTSMTRGNGLSLDQSGSSASDVGRARYNGVENDVSFCVVSNILVARMTRWQLIFEDRRAWATTIWLGRGAPQRWFRPAPSDTRHVTSIQGQRSLAVPRQGFNVSAAPTTVGRISFRVALTQATGPRMHGAAYAVDLSAASREADDVMWVARWPGRLDVTSIKCAECDVVSQDEELGLVRVRVSGGSKMFSVTAQWFDK